MAYDPTIPFWPRCLAPQRIDRGFTRPVIAGPQPLSGRRQTVMSDMGALRLRLQGVRAHDLGRLVHQLEALLFGRLCDGLPVYMPLWNWRRGPRKRAGLPLFGPLGPFGDGATFSDGSVYSQGTGDATIAANAAARATEILIDATSAAVPEGGDWISLGDRAYFVAGAWPDDTVANRWRLQIRAGLRYAVTAGDVVEIADPFFRARLDPSDMETALGLDLGIVGAVDLTFYEANWT